MIDAPYHSMETNIDWVNNVMKKGDDERILDITKERPNEPEF